MSKVEKTPPGSWIDQEKFQESQKEILETPQVPKLDGGDKKTTVLREDVGQAMNSEMVLSEMEPFLKDYGPNPNVTAANIYQCKEFLRAVGILGKTGWKGFPTRPSESGLTETEAFGPLEPLVQAIWEFAKNQGGCKNKFIFQLVPAQHLSSTISGSDHRLDGCLLEEKYVKTMIPNDTIAMPWELKLFWELSNQIKVREQIAGDCHQIMCDDPRRKFMFAVTVEDYRISFWYFSRSHSVKTLAFDWMSESGIDTFVHAMLAFAYASPEDLGFDPSVHKPAIMYGLQQYVYEFEVDDNDDESVAALPPPDRVKTRSTLSTKAPVGKKKVYYRTVSDRIPTRPVCISGRVTRILEVVQVGSVSDLPAKDAKRVILKDVWLDSKASTEGENLQQIFATVDQLVTDHPGPDGLMDFIKNEPRFKHFDDKTQKRLAHLLTDGRYKKLFLTKVLEWKGDETKELSKSAFRPDHPIFRFASRGSKGGAANRSAPAGPSKGVVASTKVTSIVPQPAGIYNRRQYDKKRQVRLVYEEVCTEIYNLPNLGAVMDIIRQALDALQILYCVGWVHRDISTGNILAVPAGEGGAWKVKLADLEFAKKFGLVTDKADPRTGTPYFMAVEIMASECLAFAGDNKESELDVSITRFTKVRNLATQFRLPRDHPDYDHFARFKMNLLPDLTELPELKNHEPLSSTFFGHNYQHDLESLWWIILYFITAGIGHKISEVFARKYFYRHMEAEKRQLLLSDRMNAKLAVLEGTLKNFVVVMETLREYLYDEYVKRVIFKEMAVHESYSLIHAVFADALDGILVKGDGKWKEKTITLMTEHPDEAEAAPPFGSTKTKRTATDRDSELVDSVKKARLE